MLRSISAILAGFFTVFALAIGANFVVVALLPSAFDAQHRTNSAAVLALLIFNTSVCQIIGGYATARIARHRPQLHAVILGVIGLVLTLPVSLLQWDIHPAWYHVTTWLLTVPAAAVGGTIAARRAPRVAPAAA